MCQDDVAQVCGQAKVAQQLAGRWQEAASGTGCRHPGVSFSHQACGTGYKETDRGWGWGGVVPCRALVWEWGCMPRD